MSLHYNMYVFDFYIQMYKTRLFLKVILTIDAYIFTLVYVVDANNMYDCSHIVYVIIYQI